MRKNGAFSVGNRSRLLFFFLVQLIHQALLETLVTVVKGDEAILQCKSPKSELNIFWRFEESTQNKVVINIVGNEEKYRDQNPMFKDRVKGFTKSEFDKGNYSIKLSNVTISDSGLYTCIIHSSNTNEYTRLTVKEKEKSKVIIAGGTGGTGKPGCMWTLLLGCILLCTLRF